MDRATRSFIYASLVYLVAGGGLGLLMAFAPRLAGDLYFPHVHLLLGGFMAMMVFGVGYFILPRFAARSLRWPSLVAVHFWMANLSLVAIAVARPLESTTGSAEWRGIFLLAAVVQLLSFVLFASNLGATLLAQPKPAQRPPSDVPDTSRPRGAGAPGLPVVGSRPSASATLGPGTPVATFVDGKEGALEVLIEAGLKPLQEPAHLEMVRRAGVPLSRACERHGIELDELLARLRALPDRQPGCGPVAIAPDQIIGEMVRRHPATREVLRKRFGEGCFTCPGFETETLAQGALMHGVEVRELVSELQRVVASGD
jgi:hybrid cluster-associated redox disulfide protein